MTNEDPIIPMTEMQLRASLLLMAGNAMIIACTADAKKGDEVYHRKLVEAEVEKIIDIVKKGKLR
jgi:hypothetical protein